MNFNILAAIALMGLFVGLIGALVGFIKLLKSKKSNAELKDDVWLSLMIGQKAGSIPLYIPDSTYKQYRENLKRRGVKIFSTSFALIIVSFAMFVCVY